MMRIGRRQVDRGHNLANQWLVTFGDLLTLLLCFFVSLLSNSSLSPYGSNRDHAVNRERGKNEPMFYKSAESTLTSGTRIAEKINELREETLIFTERDISKNNELSSEAVRLVSNQLNLEHFTLERAVIESCAELESPSREEQSWFQSIARALRLRSQVIDTGVGSELVGIRAVGPWCQALGVTQGQEKIAAVIRIRSRRMP